MGILRRSELHHPARLGDLEPHGAAVRDPHETGMAHAALGREPYRFRPYRPCAELRLAANRERALGFERPAELHLEYAASGDGDDFPTDDIGAIDAEDFACALEAEAHGG